MRFPSFTPPCHALCARAGRRRTREVRAAQMAAAGPWSLTGMPRPAAALPGAETGTGGGVDIEGGPSSRRACCWTACSGASVRGEPWLPPWRELVAVYRRREARGELRGGRFPRPGLGRAVRAPRGGRTLREVRRRAKSLKLVSLSGADPLDLAGIVTPGGIVPGDRVASSIWMASPSRRNPDASSMSEALDRAAAWEARKAQVRRGIGAIRHPAGGGRRLDHHAGRGFSVTAPSPARRTRQLASSHVTACSARHTAVAGPPAAVTERFPPAPDPFQTVKSPPQPVRPSILHCKPALNLLSFA